MVGYAQLSRWSVPRGMDAPLVDDREAHAQVHPRCLHLISSHSPMFVLRLFPFETHPVWGKVGRLALLTRNSVGLLVVSVVIHGTVFGDDYGPVQGRLAIDRGRGRGEWFSMLWTLVGAIWTPLAVEYRLLGG